MWLVEIANIFPEALTNSLHSPNGRQICLPLGMCTETVKEFGQTLASRWLSIQQAAVSAIQLMASDKITTGD